MNQSAFTHYQTTMVLFRGTKGYSKTFQHQLIEVVELGFKHTMMALTLHTPTGEMTRWMTVIPAPTLALELSSQSHALEVTAHHCSRLTPPLAFPVTCPDAVPHYPLLGFQ